MIKLEYWLFGGLALIILAVAAIIIVSFVQQGELSENKRNNFKEEFRETEKAKEADEEDEEENVASVNTSVKLVPAATISSDPEVMLHNPRNPQLMKSKEMDITAGQQWNKSTKLKYCARYKSNPLNYRSVVLLADSSLENKYKFEINIFGHKTNYRCLLIGGSPSIRGTYYIDIPFEDSSLNKNGFREVCIDDINSHLNHCVSKWGISNDDAYLTNIYQVSINSPANSLDDYAIFDYSRIFVDGDQVSDTLFPNQDFSEFSGLADDDNSDDFVGWTEHSSVYAVDIEE